MEEAEPSIRWITPAAAWWYVGDRAGPAGVAEITTGSIRWRFDWLDPSHLAEAIIVVDDDSPSSPISQEAVDLWADFCGDEAARTLMSLPGTKNQAAIWLDPERLDRRRRLGRLAQLNTLRLADPAPNWGTVEGAALALELGIRDAEDWVGSAFEVIDGLPENLLGRLVEHDAESNIRRVLLACGLADQELPEAVRLPPEEVAGRFEELSAQLEDERTSPAGPKEDLPLHRGGHAAEVPVFRGGHQEWLGLEEPSLPKLSVELIDWKAGPIEEAHAQLDSDGTRIDVSLVVDAERSPRLFARAIDPTQGFSNVIGVAPLSVHSSTGAGRWEVSGTLEVSDPADVFNPEQVVEIVTDPEHEPTPLALRTTNHAITLARCAAIKEHRVRSDTTLGHSDSRSSESAARHWRAAASEWLAADEQQRSASCQRRAAELFSLAGNNEEAEQSRNAAERIDPHSATAAKLHPQDPLFWFDVAAGIARDYLRANLAGDRTAVESALEAMDDQRLAELTVIADGVDDVAASSDLRGERARRAKRSGRIPLARALARLSVDLAQRAGTDSPQDIQELARGTAS